MTIPIADPPSLFCVNEYSPLHHHRYITAAPPQKNGARTACIILLLIVRDYRLKAKHFNLELTSYPEVYIRPVNLAYE